MLRLELTLPTAAENVALDEALLEWAEDAGSEQEVLRWWESPQPMVVVGRSSRVHQEVDEAACRDRRIPIVRRSSGGASIIAGAGCLMYAVVLSYQLHPQLKDLRRAHSFVLGRFVETLRTRLAPAVNIWQQGTSDLVLADARNSHSAPRKFSGNSMRARRTHFLYHGTLLFDFDPRLIASCLKMPPRQPSYRAARVHEEFVANLPLTRREVIGAINSAWPTNGELLEWPTRRVASLIAERFGAESWNFEFR